MRYLLALLAIVLTGLFALLYYWANGKWDGLMVAVIPNVIATCASFAVIYFVLERRGIFLSSPSRMELLSHAEYERHDHVDWGEFIRSANSLDIVVFYDGSWVRKHNEDFVQFFQRGGKLRLFVSDPGNKLLMAVAQRHFFQRLSRADLAKKVRETFDALLQAAEESGTIKGSVTVYAFSELLHYSFVLVDDQELYLSFYEQFRHPKVRSPVFHIRLKDKRDAATYLYETRDTYLDQSVGPEFIHGRNKRLTCSFEDRPAK